MAEIIMDEITNAELIEKAKSLKDPNFAYPSAQQIASMLEQAGFQAVEIRDPSALGFAEVEFHAGYGHHRSF